MANADSANPLPLPKGWRPHVRSALLHVVSLAHAAITAARARAATSRSERIRLAGALERAQAEIGLLQEELRIKDARMAKLAPRHRPHYGPVDRLAILSLRAARGWSASQVAERFFVRAATIAAWMRRVDEEGVHALVQSPTPINRFPDFVADVVQRLKRLCPTMGKKRIAQTLARAGLHLGVSTVKRMLERARPSAPNDAPDGPASEAPRKDAAGDEAASTPVRAKAVHHTWQVDLTLVPAHRGLWTPWFPFALPPRWPYCWWVACVIDQHSRRILDFAVFPQAPSGAQVAALFRRIETEVKQRPRYLISDHGTQFVSEEMKRWCAQGVRHRFAAVGVINATAVIERFFLSLKREALEHLAVSFRVDVFRRQIQRYLDWYHAHRPHQGLGGRTPNEVYFGRTPTNTQPRFEPRPGWPARTPCAQPQAPKKRRHPDAPLELGVRWLDEGAKLPIVELKRAA